MDFQRGHRQHPLSSRACGRVAMAVLLACAVPAMTGAAVGRMGGEFAVSAQGAATYTVPFDVSPGASGLRPAVALAYSSQAPGGVAGPGWSLVGFPAITRCPLTRAVDGRTGGVRVSAEDRLCLDGQPLVLVAGSHGQPGAEYRTEVHAQARVIAQGRQGNGPAWFEVRRPDGRVERYGSDADSRFEAAGSAEVLSWSLAEVEDRHQRRMDFGYTEDNARGEHYPAEIRWSPGPGETPAQARFRLAFSWEARPPAEIRAGYRAGFPWRASVRLAAVDYEARDASGGLARVHRYALEYLPGSASATGRGLLARVTQCGPTDCLPPTVFTWDADSHGFTQAIHGGPNADRAVFGDFNGDGAADLFGNRDGNWTAWAGDPQSGGFRPGVPLGPAFTGTSSAVPLEFNGDGLTDLLVGSAEAGTWTAYLAPGRPGDPFTATPAGLGWAPGDHLQALDVDGDGLDDIVYLRNGALYLRRNTGSGFAAEQAAGLAPVAAPYVPFTGSFGFLEPADFDGDGRADLLLARSAATAGGTDYRYEAFLSTGTGFAAEPIGSFDTPANTQNRILLADLNGDGLTDVLHNVASRWQSYISRGAGAAGGAVLVRENCAAPVYQGTNWLLAVLDVDGDGRSDLLRNENSTRWRAYLSDGACLDASRYVDPPAPAPPQGADSATAVDVDGDGNSDVVMKGSSASGWVILRDMPPARADGATLQYRADLLRRVTDGLGNWHEVDYRPLAGWTGYEATGTGGAEARLLRGAALAVVSRQSANTGIGDGAWQMTYRYANARVDRLGRGFLGFERVRASDSRDGLARETVYAQGFPYTGRVELETVWNGSQRVSEVDPAWGDSATAAADAAGDVHFVHLAGEVTSAYETDVVSGMAGSLVRQSTRTLAWNVAHAAVSRDDSVITAPQRSGITHRATRVTSFDEAARATSGCLGLPTRVETTGEVSGAPGASRVEQFSHDPVTCRVTSRTTDGAQSPQQQLRTTWAYDASGRLELSAAADVAGTEPPRQSRLSYDGDAAIPAAEELPVQGEADLVTRQAWNEALGVATSRTTPQGQVTRWTHDEFGRLLAEARPAGNSRFTYTACGPCFAPHARYAVREERSNGAWSETQHDSFGRTVGRAAVLPDGTASRQVVEYDALGRLSRESAPFRSDDGPRFWTSYRYETGGRLKAVERPTSEQLPVGALETFAYAGLETTVRDAEYRVRTLAHDAAGRLVAVSEMLGAGATFEYTPFGDLAAVTDAAGNVRRMSYDTRGRLLRIEDPDSGLRVMQYNAFGELVSQTDGREPPATVTWRRDPLGRVVERREPEGVTTWSYSPAPGSSRALLSRVTGPTQDSPAGFTETYAYDARSRLQRVVTGINGSSYQTDYAYDASGQLRAVTYPFTVGWRPRFVFGYSFGHLTLVAQDAAGVSPVYSLLATTAGGRETEVSFGFDHLREEATYDEATGRLRALRAWGAGAPGDIQDYAYDWDRVGNLLARRDLSGAAPVAEQFSYDNLNRLSQVSLNGTLTLRMGYTADGNIRNKSDVGNFAYGADGHPHAVTAVGGGPRGIMTFGYDANGNMTDRNGTAIEWTSFNMPLRIVSGASQSRFSYGPGRGRIVQDSTAAGRSRTTHYVGPHFEVEMEGATRRFRSTVFANGRAVYSQVESTPSGLEAYYVLHDHQGSVDRLVRAVGAGPDALAQHFDAWGKRRNADWTADPGDRRYRDPRWTARGYTGHEHLDDAQLVHMNGRLQDPLLGRMLSPDPSPGNPSLSQALNPYAYVTSNPASYFDPSGYFLSKLRNGVVRAFRHTGRFLRRFMKRWGRTVVATVAAYYTGGAVSSWAYGGAVEGAAAGTATAAGTGGTLGASYTTSLAIGGAAGGAVGGAIVTGSLRGTLAGAATGGLMGGIAGYYGGGYTAGRVLAEAAVGGASAELQGGEFGQGFLVSGGLSSLTWAALEMREAMIAQSQLDPKNRNGRGISSGFRDDGFKLGGCRAPCTWSPLGGSQGGTGNFLGIEYRPGSFLDRLIETYAGPHDFLNSPIFYDAATGNSLARPTGFEVVNAANVMVATPFAAASVIPGYAYGYLHD